MIIAAAVNEGGIEAVIPAELEEAKGLLFVETDDMSAVHYSMERAKWVGEMVSRECEAILCGQMRDPGLFEAIARACVTRYYAPGLTARAAVEAMNAYRLDIIRDYVDGPGCSGEDHGTPGEPRGCNCSAD